MVRHKRLLEESLTKLNKNDYVEDGQIITGDFFEDLFSKLVEYKKIVRADFVGFKGVTDEMNTFADSINLNRYKI